MWGHPAARQPQIGLSHAEVMAQACWPHGMLGRGEMAALQAGGMAEPLPALRLLPAGAPPLRMYTGAPTCRGRGRGQQGSKPMRRRSNLSTMLGPCSERLRLLIVLGQGVDVFVRCWNCSRSLWMARSTTALGPMAAALCARGQRGHQKCAAQQRPKRNWCQLKRKWQAALSKQWVPWPPSK